MEGKFTDKGGAAKLLHMVFTVAREPVMGPSVIYIDEVSSDSFNCGCVRAGGPATDMVYAPRTSMSNVTRIFAFVGMFTFIVACKYIFGEYFWPVGSAGLPVFATH